ncbi:hypothetical protein [Caulobacter segnis]|nr:hypothetical protein [Caulobacter segnis]MDR6623875.1 hypothetical protein [Caulobacter segnis]
MICALETSLSVAEQMALRALSRLLKARARTMRPARRAAIRDVQG